MIMLFLWQTVILRLAGITIFLKNGEVQKTGHKVFKQ